MTTPSDADLKRYLAGIDEENLLERIEQGEEVGPAMAESAPALENMSAPRDMGAAADRAVRKLARDEALAPDERFALEAIVFPRERPVFDIVDDTWSGVVAPWEHFDDPPIRATLEPLIPSIGRVEVPGHPSVPYAGTGFIVGDGLLMTNRHVAEIFASGLGAEGVAFLPGRTAAVDFVREIGREDKGEIFAVAGIAMIHPYWDMALLSVPGLAGRRTLQLSLMPPEDAVNRDVAIIGYPGGSNYPDANGYDVQDRLFRKKYFVKRLLPGRLRPRAEIDSYNHMVNAVTHDASTLGGNSGSAVIDAHTGEILALHFAGQYLKTNYAVPSAELARDGRVVEAGVAFAGTPRPGPTPGDGQWPIADPTPRARTPESAVPPLQSPPPSAPDSATATGGGDAAAPAAVTARITIPITLDITVGLPQVATAPGSAPALTVAAAPVEPAGTARGENVGRTVGAADAGSAAGGRTAPSPRRTAATPDASVTLIHGIGNKPEADSLAASWLASIKAGGLDLAGMNVAVEMVYWADVLYEAPEVVPEFVLGTEAVVEAIAGEDVVLPANEADEEWMASLVESASRGVYTVDDGRVVAENPAAAAREFPDFLERWFLRRFLRDVHHYLYDVEHVPRPGERYQVRQEIRGRMLRTLQRQVVTGVPNIIVSHSMGTVIAYDVLKSVADCPPVTGLLTLGSPLGLGPIQERLDWKRDTGFPAARLKGPWTNIFDRRDIVAAGDPEIADDMKKSRRKVVKDIAVSNNGSLHHALDAYVRTAAFQSELAALLEQAGG